MNAATTPTAVSEIRASRFVLSDELGNERAVLEFHEGEPSFKLLGRTGQTMIKIELVAEWGGTPSVMLYCDAPDEPSFVRLDASSGGEAGVLLGGSHRRVTVTNNRTGQPPLIQLTDDKGTIVAQLPEVPGNGVSSEPLQQARS